MQTRNSEPSSRSTISRQVSKLSSRTLRTESLPRFIPPAGKHSVAFQSFPKFVQILFGDGHGDLEPPSQFVDDCVFIGTLRQQFEHCRAGRVEGKHLSPINVHDDPPAIRMGAANPGTWCWHWTLLRGGGLALRTTARWQVEVRASSWCPKYSQTRGR